MNTEDDDTPIPRRRADRERWLFIGGGIAGVIVIAALSFGLGRLSKGSPPTSTGGLGGTTQDLPLNGKYPPATLDEFERITESLKTPERKAENQERFQRQNEMP